MQLIGIAEITGELVGEAFRLNDRAERSKQILKLQGLDLWSGDLAVMRDDLPREDQQATSSTTAASANDLHHAVAALRLRHALEQMEPALRELLYLRYFQGLSAAEIGKLFESSTETIEKRIHDAFTRAWEIYRQPS